MGKRGRKPSAERKGYFYENEENAVVEYLNATDIDEKNRIFAESLYPAFTKMIESIIRRYNLYPPDEIFQETFDDTLSFLLTKIEHYKPESGFKAYSYCGTVCKNYLILKITQYHKNLARNDRYELVQNEIDDNVKFSYIEETEVKEDANEMIGDILKEINEIIKNEKELSLTDNEIKVGNALISLLSNWGELFARMGSNKFNKSSILMYIKELTLLNTTDIRNAMKRYKTLYLDMKKRIIEDIY